MTRILAFTCYTNGREHVTMTSDACSGMCDAFHWAGVDGMLSVCNQGAKPIDFSLWRYKVVKSSLPENKGFAVGMNTALKAVKDQFDYYLCFNNDIDFSPDRLWLKEMLQVAVPERVIVPRTTVTACKEQKGNGPLDKPAFDVPATPAVLWLIPGILMDELLKIGKGNLFPESLGRAWGEDTVVASRLQKIVGKNAFRIVPRAFVRHLGERTSLTIPVKERMEAVRRARRLIDGESGSRTDD